MKFVLALNSLGIGGTESYTLTVAEHLDRLAHGVAVFSPEPGRGVEVARERGIEMIDSARLAEEEYDVAIVQDAAVSFEVADRLPSTPQLFIGHSDSFDPQGPPQLSDLVQVAVALNERVATRMSSQAVAADVVRLRQPIDTDRFRSRGALPETPRRALVLSNNHVSDRMSMLESACEKASIELLRRGGSSGQVTDPRAELARADIVIGYGRSILEAMALGRSVYVYDTSGGDGWVTLESYAPIEAQGFAGRTGQVIDVERLRADLELYTPSMGPVNRDLITAHHRANAHVHELVEIARGLAPTARRVRAPLDEMARMVRQEWRARSEIHALLGEVATVRGETATVREELEEEKRQRVRSVQDALNADAARVREVEEIAHRYQSSLSWRLTAPLRYMGKLLRRLRR